MASLFRPVWTRAGVKHRCKTWWGQWRDTAGVLRRQSLRTTNKTAAQLRLADLVRSGSRPGADKPIAGHVTAWETSLATRGTSAAHIALAVGRVRRAVTSCGWARLRDACATSAESFLSRLTADGLAAKTRNDYADHLRAFGRWLVKTKQLADSPFADLPRLNVETDRRHDRRAHTLADVSALLTATTASARVFRGLRGPDRRVLYLTAISTGFRAGELAALTPSLFRLDDSPPVVLLAARDDKSRHAVRQPLPASVVPILRDYLRGRDPAAPVWPGTWSHEPIKMMRMDLAAAGIPYVVDGPDGPLYADFYALRHTFLSYLDSPEISIKQAMALARHRNPALTMRVYAKARLADLGAAADIACDALAPLAHVLAQAPCADARTSTQREGPSLAATGT